MPKLSEAQIAIRVNQAMQVFGLMQENPKITLKEACQTLGITPRMYRFWIRESVEAVELFQEVKQQVERAELANILMMKERIQQRLLEDASLRSTDPLTRLSILNYLDARIDTLSARHRVTDSSTVRELLSGPIQQPGENRFASGSEQELEVTAGEDGSVTVRARKIDIVDAEILDSDPLIR